MSTTHVGLIAVAVVVLLAPGLAAADDPLDGKVTLPQRLMTSQEVLREVNSQTGARYAYPTGALVRQIDATPFAGQPVAVKDVVAKLAAKVSVVNEVILLEADLTDAELERVLAIRDEAVRAAFADLPQPPPATSPAIPEAPFRLAPYLLGNTRSTRAIRPLFEALAAKGESTRHHALRSLDRLERDFIDYHPPGRVSIFALTYDGSADALVQILQHSPQASHEWVWAAGLVGRLSRPQNAREPLTAGSKNGYARTAKTAQWALGRLEPAAEAAVKPSPAVPTVELLKTLAAAKDSEAKAALLLQLGRAGGKDAWDTLLAQLADKDIVIRQAAIRGLDRCPDPRAADALLAIMIADKTDGEERNWAAMSLGMIASPRVVELLTDYVAKTAKPISSAALALSWTADGGNGAAQAGLIECVSKKDTDEHGTTHCVLRSYAYIGLARLGTPQAVAAIASKYNEYDNTARYVGHSAIRLAGAWTQSAVDHFVGTIQAGRGKIAVHGLEMAEDPRAVDALIEAAGKSTGDRLHWVVQALGRCGDPAAVGALIGLLDHKESWVQYEALRGLRWRWNWHRPGVQAALAKHPVFKAYVAPPPSLADQPENTWVLRHFPIDFDDYRAVNTTYEAGMVFDESTGKAVKVNSHGQRCDAPQLAETWLFDPKTNTWAETNSPVQPFGMCGTWNLAYDRLSQKTVFLQAEGGNHGWQWDRPRALRSSTPWVYDGRSDTWTPMWPLSQPGGPGMRAFSPIVYVDSIGKVLIQGGSRGGDKETAHRTWTYDVASNAWTMLPESKENPGNPNHQPMCYMPNIDKVVLVAGGRTWLFDPKTEQWSDAKAAGTPKARLPLVYDPISGTALLFDAQSNGTTIWQYDAKANAWAKVDSPVDVSPHHDSVDCVYDPANNVFIMDGGHVNWNTDHIAVREVWTYKFKNPAKPAEQPTGPRGSYVGLTRVGTPIPAGVVVSVQKDRTVAVRWDPPASGRAITALSYDVYAAAVEVGDKMHHKEVFRKYGPFEKLNKAPISGTEFVDARKLADATGLFNHEIRAYYVKAVARAGATNDSLTIESGPSATVLTLTSSVPRARAAEQPDGSTLIQWDASPEKDIRGYAVYRMDEFRGTLAVRLNPVPVQATRFADMCESPRAERRRYYVVAVDALGQEGIPSTGAWSFGRP